ncbi:Rne/Rng family ribonuclease [Donghicola tyrosinivorans]|nr:ribonuclease E/G [Donghicola tyrosinivorans]
MGKKMLIDATHAEETRVVVVDGNKVEEFDFESENKRQLAGNIYLAKVTRVEPSLQAAFVDYGGNRHGFLAFSEIHPDYYQIPVADREALLAEERAYAQENSEDDDESEKPKSRSRRSRSRSKSKPAQDKAKSDAPVADEAETSSEEAPVADDAVETPVEAVEPAAEAAPVDAVEETAAVEETTEEAAPEAQEAVAEEAVAEAPAEEVPVGEEAAPEEVVAEEPAAEEPVAEDVAEAEDEGEDAGETTRRPPAQAARNDSDDAVETREITGMETIDLEEDEQENAAPEVAEAPEAAEDAEEASEEEKKPSRSRRSRIRKPAAKSKEAAPAEEPSEDAGEEVQPEDTIESIAVQDDEEEDIRPVRKPRARRYKIQEVIKVRQIMLVQVVKEERGNKGAALTTYLSLAGRYCVLMPNTARGGGISRKITNAADRKKLKEIAGELDVPIGAGLIIRTAGAERTKAEIKRDYEYLQRMWEQIRELTLKSVAPCKIYEEGDLIKRSIRDLYSREIDEVLVEGDLGYRNAKDFMKMIMPSHAKNVKNYTDRMPLFARYQVESYLSSMFNPTVQLKSGGYIVIGVTEALVAIDVNSGKATKEGSIEETALKTNLEAAEEVARQLRLRDLAGLIVIDFIDMDERKNNTAVEKRLKDKLKTDRARIQVGRISGFGLLEMSRQRLRPGMIEATTQPCPHCHGTGLLRSDDNVSLAILRQLEEEGVRGRSKEVLIKAPVQIANYLINHKREHVAQIESRYGMAVRIEADVHLISPDYGFEKFKSATRVIGAVEEAHVSVDTSIMDALDAEIIEETAPEEVQAEAVAEEPAAPEAAGEETPKPKKRRRRRRRGGKAKENGADDAQAEGDTDDDAADSTEDQDKDAADVSEAEVVAPEVAEEAVAEAPAADEAAAEVAEEAPAALEDTAEVDAATPEEQPAEVEAEPEAAAPVADAAEEVVAEEAEPVAEEPAQEVVADEPVQEDTPAEIVEEAPVEVVTEAEETPAEEPAAEEEASPPKPKRKGWWSMG